jgi:DNA-binding NtrC family response regulator
MEESLPEMLSRNGASGTAWGSWLMQGSSPAIQAVGRIIDDLANSDVPVLLMGEAGAGKRAAAERIHLLSARANQPFQVEKARELTPEVIFGAGAGPNPFAEGTVFLDEISGLGESAQQALLNRLSATASNSHRAETGARIICGTGCDLEAEVRTRNFREDLYYRISAVSLRIPPVRQRKEDIPQLVDSFLARYAVDFGRPIPELRAETRHFFQEYAWPGNLPELADAAKAIVALGDDALAMGGLRSLLARSEKTNGREKVSLKEAAKAASREAEKELILRVLTRTRWNRRRAAQELQISYKALLYKLKQIGYGEFEAS